MANKKAGWVSRLTAGAQAVSKSNAPVVAKTNPDSGVFTLLRVR